MPLLKLRVVRSPPRSQVKQQPNPTPMADNKTIHTPPPQLYQKLQFTNLYIPLPSQRFTRDNRDIPQETPPQHPDEFGVTAQPE